MTRSQIRACTTALSFSLAATLANPFLEAQQSLPEAPKSASLTATTPASAKRSRTETSVSLGASAQLTATRVTDGQFFGTLGSQSLDPSAGVLFSVRQSFRPWLGYSANLGYTRTTEENAGTRANGSAFAIPNNVYETTIAYLVQRHITPRLTGFVDLGGGALTFLPTQGGMLTSGYFPHPSIAVPSVLVRAVGVAGGGVDYHLNTRLAIRAEYRGLLYKYPDYGGLAGREITVSSQPTASITYTFGRGKSR